MALTGPAANDRRFTRLVVALFALAGLAMVLVLAAALGVLGGQAKAVCADPPRLHSELPQPAILGILVACFLAGGLTASWSMRAVHHVGHSRARSILEDRRNRLVMRLTFIAVFLLLTLLMALEAGALYFHVWPITYYVRCANQGGTLLTVLGAGLYSFLAGRWLWVWR